MSKGPYVFHLVKTILHLKEMKALNLLLEAYALFLWPMKYILTKPLLENILKFSKVSVVSNIISAMFIRTEIKLQRFCEKSEPNSANKAESNGIHNRKNVDERLDHICKQLKHNQEELELQSSNKIDSKKVKDTNGKIISTPTTTGKNKPFEPNPAPNILSSDMIGEPEWEQINQDRKFRFKKSKEVSKLLSQQRYLLKKINKLWNNLMKILNVTIAFNNSKGEKLINIIADYQQINITRMSRLLIDMSQEELAFKFISSHQIELRTFILNHMIDKIISKRLFKILLVLTPLQIMERLNTDNRYAQILKVVVESDTSTQINNITQIFSYIRPQFWTMKRFMVFYNLVKSLLALESEQCPFIHG